MSESNKDVTVTNGNKDHTQAPLQPLLPIDDEEFENSLKVGDVVLLHQIRNKVIEFNANNTQVLLGKWLDGMYHEIWHPMKQVVGEGEQVVDDDTKVPDPTATSEVEMPQDRPGEHVKTLVQAIVTATQIEEADRQIELMIAEGYILGSEQIIWDHDVDGLVRVVRFVKPFVHPADRELNQLYDQLYGMVVSLDNVIRRRTTTQ
ncbi:hypothetical protein G4Y79_15105 [Phototrophicus methaneseepsis]|uniref:Uncharacterized protein n=1 Tax=Phototrophicus methaneseepsis TaxID=2710758 RepID=A0A7S8ID03_9CHLR|nr:hypothetical protein [Phototrophicus methaneseepsis]QPC81031.1 hypothetical protein G4Y79_15105 [Phototrophicus methaneseepsis]